MKKFNDLYQKIINESKNIPINKQFVQNIYQNFKQGNILIYNPDNIILYNKNQEFKQYKVYVIISNEKNINKVINKFPQLLQEYNQRTLINQFMDEFGGFIQLKQIPQKFLFLNFDKINKNKIILKNIISHQLTHFFENGKYKWTDLLPKQLNSNKEPYLYSKIFDIVNNLGFSYNTIYQLTRKQQFQAYCTILENQYKKINLQKINRQFFNTKEFDQLSEQLRRLYLFIYFNKILDPTNLRYNYILQHFGE